jgi:hypothetical protein
VVWCSVAGASGLWRRLERQTRLLDLDQRKLFCHRLQGVASLSRRRAQGLGRFVGAQVARQNRYGFRQPYPLWRAAAELATRQGNYLLSAPRPAANIVSQGQHAAVAADRRREYPLGFVYANRVEFLKSRKAPLGWVLTMNPIVTPGGPLALAARAQA